MPRVTNDELMFRMVEKNGVNVVEVMTTGGARLPDITFEQFVDLVEAERRAARTKRP